MGISRRAFLKASGAGITALMAPQLFARNAFAHHLPGPPVLVSIFLRFGTDGLTHVAPVDDEWYQTIRPTIGMSSVWDTVGDPQKKRFAEPLGGLYKRAANTGSALESGYFHLNANMDEMRNLLYSPGHAENTAGAQMAIVHALGGSGSHSHFTAQDACERANPSQAFGDGWLQRAAEELDLQWQQDGLHPIGSPQVLTGIALSGRPIEALNGSIRGYHMNFPTIDSFKLVSSPYDGDLAEIDTPGDPGRMAVLKRAYASMGNSPASAPIALSDLARESGSDIFEAMENMRTVSEDTSYVPYDYDFRADAAPGTIEEEMIGSNGSTFSTRLRDAARLIKAGSTLGTRVMAIDMPGGWDYHSSVVDATAPHARLLSQGLARFYKDLGNDAQRVVTIVMSEFGRTAYENGGDLTSDPPRPPGTDHGDGGICYVIGAGVQGNRVLCRDALQTPATVSENISWPGLAPGQLSSHGNYAIPFVNPNDPTNNYAVGERDLASTIDFRDVYGDVLKHHMGLDDTRVANVLRGYQRVPLPDGGCFDAD